MELSSRYPQEGGLYLWTKRAFGDFPAFLTGWIYWTSNLPYFPAVLYFAASNALYIGGTRWNALQRSPLYFIAFSFFGVGLALALNVVGLNIGKWLNNSARIGTWIPVALLCVRRPGRLDEVRLGHQLQLRPNVKPSLNLGMLGVWATLLYAFSGAEAASFMGDEIKDARRILPRALIVAGVIITARLHSGNDRHPGRAAHIAGQQHGRHHAGHHQRRRARRLVRHRAPPSRC